MAFNTSAIDNFMVQLAGSAIRTLFVAALAGVALFAFRVKSPSLRLHAWRSVLYLALAMPVLAVMLPPLEVPIPSLVAPGAAQTSHAVRLTRAEHSPIAWQGTVRSNSAKRPTSAPKSMPGYADSQGPAERSLDWKEIVPFFYFATTLFLLIRIGIGLAFAFGLTRSSSEITDPELSSRLTEIAQRYKMDSAPRIFESDSISVPLTIGALRPVILLPEGWRE